MKKYYLLAALAMISIVAGAQTKAWTNDPTHSRLGFVVKHLTISEVEGRFASFSATVVTTKADYSDAQVDLTAKIASINTEVEARDKHLLSADFFDAEKYPTLTFKSTSLKKVSAKKGLLSGKLTFHGITRPVTLNVDFLGMVTNPMNKKLTAGFKITGVVKRSDFALGKGFANAVLSENVKIVANLEFTPDK